MSWTPDALHQPRWSSPPVDAPSWAHALMDLDDEDPFSLAVLGGRGGGTVGLALCFGYQAALRSMLPELASGRVMAVCATESGGTHPRAIHTRLREGVLTGVKTVVTLGTVADLLLVIATAGVDDAGRSRLVGCVVEPSAPGITMAALSPLPMVPDVPHAQLTLAGVRPTMVLPLDGYSGILKPLRTVEDIYVHASVAAWLVGVVVEHGWPDELAEALLVSISALAQTAAMDPTQPGTHRLLGGALSHFAHVVASVEPCMADAADALQAMWARDRSVLGMAKAAREARLLRARAVQPRRLRQDVLFRRP